MFEPLYNDHSIESVIFRLTGRGELMEHERANLRKGYETYWKAVLPKEIQAHVMEIAMGPTPLVDGQQKPLAPTTYVEYMRTGKASWWMEIAGPTITIGCSQYSGWKSVSGKTFELLGSLGDTLGSDHPLGKICSAELTYMDILHWKSNDDAYDPRLAIQERWIPDKALDSKEWHLGEGWINDPDGERTLERFLISAERQGEGSRIRVETTAIWGFGNAEPRLSLNMAFKRIQEVTGNNIDGRAKYNELHAQVKILLGKLIAENLAERICLHKLGDLK